MKDIQKIQLKLQRFHADKAKKTLTKFSDIAGDQFQGEFNVSGFHKEILGLPNKPSSVWGIDRCLRIQEIPDSVHSYVFHMGIFAKSIDLKKDFIDPFKDKRFHKLQEELIAQFLGVLDTFKLDLSQVEVTYLDGLSIGGSSKGRDKILKRKYRFPTDTVSRSFLNGKVRLFPVKSLMNVDVHPIEGALVGPRLEVAYRGIEIATVVFNCFKIKNGNLAPINYVAGYAIGIERLMAALDTKNFITSIPRYQEAHNRLVRSCKAANSSLFEKEVVTLIYGTEALAHIPKRLSTHQKIRVRALKDKVEESNRSLGINT